MIKNLKVALLQLLPKNTLEENLQKGVQHCKKAKEMGADIALFPEMWSVGYNIPENIDELKASAISADSEFMRSFAALAKELDMLEKQWMQLKVLFLPFGLVWTMRRWMSSSCTCMRQLINGF